MRSNLKSCSAYITFIRYLHMKQESYPTQQHNPQYDGCHTGGFHIIPARRAPG